MMINKIAVCPICKKRTFLRIQDGGYLNEYPIRVNCINCRALIKGTYIMDPMSKLNGLNLVNADIEECDLDNDTLTVRNADYVNEISGELPSRNVSEYEGGLPVSPFLSAADNLESMEEHLVRLKYFTKNMADWKKTKSIAFQLLDEGSIDYIATALSHQMGEYKYECNNNLKSLQCLQEAVLEETKYLFFEPTQDEYVTKLINELSQIDKEKLHQFASEIGGIEEIILAFRKTMEVISDFMNIYPNLLPAETYLRFKNKENTNVGIATCSFGDIKTYYQDAYESLISLLYIPVCLDNIILRGDYNTFSSPIEEVFCKKFHKNNVKCDFGLYRSLDNGTKINKLCNTEPYQKIIDIPANRLLRNGIGHNNIKYDGITQKIIAYDLKIPNKVNFEKSLVGVAIDCLGLAKSAVVYSEILLFILREEFRRDGIHSILHPRFYKGTEPNSKCPCGSNAKYKKCCRSEVEDALRSK